jgi:alpha-L-rhamnosidase
MNSFNHYAYGAVGNWMYQTLGGINIDPRAPGYAHFLIQVQPGGGFTHARTEHDSPYGRIRTDWILKGGRMSLNLLIPANSGATVRVPRTRTADISKDREPLRDGDGIVSAHQDLDDTVIELRAGQYHFTYPYTPPAKPAM